MRSVRSATVSALVATVLLVGCNKDELTVQSTASEVTSVCGPLLVELNIDSLLQCDEPAPWQPDLEIEVCECDTLLLHPVNIPVQYEFDEWTVDQGMGWQEHEGLFLDTLTINTALDLEFSNGPSHEHLRINVVVSPCE